MFNSYYGKGGDTGRSYTQAVNPAVKAYNYLSANVQYKLGKNFIIGVYANNMLDEKIYYPEYRARTVNSLPGRAGRAIHGTLTFKL